MLITSRPQQNPLRTTTLIKSASASLATQFSTDHARDDVLSSSAQMKSVARGHRFQGFEYGSSDHSASIQPHPNRATTVPEAEPMAESGLPSRRSWDLHRVGGVTAGANLEVHLDQQILRGEPTA